MKKFSVFLSLLFFMKIAVAQINLDYRSDLPSGKGSMYWFDGNYLNFSAKNYERSHVATKRYSNYRGTYDFTTSDYPRVHHGAGSPSGGFNHYRGVYNAVIDFGHGISLSYHTAGIQVNQVSSWVGLGWELHCGGVISRQVRDLPDDYFSVLDIYNQDPIMRVGWIPTAGIGVAGSKIVAEFPSQITPGDYQDEANLISGLIGESFLHPNSYYKEKYDTEPDIFNVNVGEVNGQFVFEAADEDINQKPKALTIPYQNIKIDYSKDLGGVTIESFTIIDSKGVSYYFNDKEIIYTNSYVEISKEETEDENTSGSLTIINRSKANYTVNWLLTEVTYPNQEKIAFTYEDEKVRLDEGLYNTYRTKNNSDELITAVHTNQDVDWDVVPHLLAKRLSAIESANYKVEFIANEVRDDLKHLYVGTMKDKPSKSLNKIKVYNKSGSDLYIEKIISFYHSYFEYDPIEPGYQFETYISDATGYKRLKLDSVQVSGAEFIHPSYKFSYYGMEGKENDSWLPPRFAYAQDFWGYFNGIENNSLRPKTYFYPELTGGKRFSVFQIDGLNPGLELNPYGANRNSNEKAFVGNLKEIKFPSGGKQQFNYELNDFKIYSDADAGDYCGAGIRLKEIITDPIIGPITTTSYSYDDPEYINQTSGKLINVPQFGYLDPSNAFAPDCNYHYFNNSLYDEWYLLNGGELMKNHYLGTTGDMSDYSDGIIGYNTVTEKVNNGKGETEYYFHNDATYYDDYSNVEYPFFEIIIPQLLPSWKDIESYEVNSNPPLNVPYSNMGLELGVNSYPYIMNTNYSWHRGLPEKVVVKNSLGSIVRKKEFEYKNFYKNGSSPTYSYGLKINFLENNIRPFDLGCPDPTESGYLWNKPYVVGKYKIHTEIAPLPEVIKTTVFDDNQNSQVVLTTNFYNLYGQLAQTKTVYETLEEDITKYKYPVDYWDIRNPPIPNPSNISDPMLEAIILMGDNNNIDAPIETTQFIKENPGSEELVSASLNLYSKNSLNGKEVAVSDVNNRIFIKEPLTIFNESSISVSQLKFQYDQHYEQVNSVNERNEKGSILEYEDRNGIPHVKLYLNNQNTTKAEAQNALLSEFYYSSFEANEKIAGVEGNAKSGKRYKEVTTTPVTYTIDFTEIDKNSCGGYKATVWCKSINPAYLNIQINNDASTLRSVQSSGTNEWELLDISLTREEISNYTGVINEIMVKAGSSNNQIIWLDEYKVFPLDAECTFNTYDHLLRITATSGRNNLYSYYEYDGIGNIIRDDDNNISTYNQKNSKNIAMFIAYQIEPGDQIIVTQKAMFLAVNQHASNYEWDFGDGTETYSSSYPSIGHLYSEPGYYDVTLTITDYRENQYSSTQRVIISSVN